MGGPSKIVQSALRSSFFLPRGRACGRTYKRIAVLVDCCACLVFCWLISVSFCVTFSFILCVVLFVIKFIKYNGWSFPSLGRKWTRHRVERETRHVSWNFRFGLGFKEAGLELKSEKTLLCTVGYVFILFMFFPVFSSLWRCYTLSWTLLRAFNERIHQWINLEEPLLIKAATHEPSLTADTTDLLPTSLTCIIIKCHTCAFGRVREVVQNRKSRIRAKLINPVRQLCFLFLADMRICVKIYDLQLHWLLI